MDTCIVSDKSCRPTADRLLSKCIYNMDQRRKLCNKVDYRWHTKKERNKLQTGKDELWSKYNHQTTTDTDAAFKEKICT